MVATLWSIVLLVILVVIAIKIWPFRRVVVYEYQRGLKYTNGRFRRVLDAGQYWVFPPTTSMTVVDVRPQFVTIPGQEVITADGVTLKVSLAAEFEVANPDLAINKNSSYAASFYLVLQMALRQIIGGEKIDAIVESRSSISARLVEATREKITALGLKVNSVDLKDIMVPGELRRTFSQVVKAQKEGLAALERARGETAALRNLGNAAKMMDDNPNLLQLRALQMLSESTGNTIVFGVPGAPLPVAARKNGEKIRPQEDVHE